MCAQFKQFLSFVRKEFIHIFRDKVTILILIVLPLVLIGLFGFAITTELKESRVLIVDQMQDEMSSVLIQTIHANHYFDVTNVVHDSCSAEDYMKNGAADVVLLLDTSLGIQILADASEPNQAQSRAVYMTQILTPLLAQQGGDGVVSTRMLFNPQLKSEYNFVPGVIGLVILLICSLMTSLSIVREKEMGTMEILLASPLPPITIIVAKLIPYFTVSSINVVNILLMSRFLLGIPISGSVATFLLISIVYIFVSLALGLLISTVANSQLVAMLLSILLIVPGLYLSGMVFNVESMPVVFQRISTIVPMRWYVDATKRLLIQGVEFQYVVKDLVVLFVEAVVLIGISLKVFKTRLE
ncbi:MAG: ABC transporter permease [Bacteroidales bacterium]|nr:ABC transporter permease [Bacteroidales bacterium]